MMILFGALLSGAAQASDQKSRKEVKALVKEQTGYDVQSKGADIQKDIERLLSASLNEDAAVAIAFLNSPVIKAQFASLGISEADVREAGILTNPTFSYSSRESDEDGARRNTEFEIKQDVFDVLFWPLRQKIAGTRFKASQYEAAHEMTDFIKDVRLTYLEWLTAMHKQGLAVDHFKAQEASLEIARRQREAGNINALKMAEVQAMFQKAKIERLKFEQEAQRAKEHLRTTLGLKPDQFFMEELLQIPDLPNEKLVLKELEHQALNNRLDLLMKHQEIKTLEQSQKLAGMDVLSEFEVGYNQETETNGHKLKGVVIEGQVPVFNRNQAQRMGIKASIQTAQFQLDAMQQQALLEVRLAYQDLLISRQIVEAFKETIPLYQQMVKETLYQYNFMLTDVFHLLEAKQKELEAKKEYADALKGYWTSRIELENAVGSKLGSVPNKPSADKKLDQTKAADHEQHHGE